MRAFASSRPSVRNELEERRARIAREHGAHLTALALPDQAARARGDFTARVSARFRGAPEREDRVEAVRLDAFRGPVELAVESGPGGTSMGQLVLVAPERDRAFAQEIEFIILDRTSGKPGPRRKARLGEQVALPEGRYDVWPMRRGARKAFAKATVDIVGSQVAELPLEWAAGVVLHEVRCREAATGRPCGRGYAQLVVEVPGKGHGVFDAMRDRDGVARFWLPHEVTSAELCNSGWQRQDIEFSATPRAGVVAAEVALEPIVGEAGK